MYSGEAHQQGIHLCRSGNSDFCQGETLWMHHHCFLEEAKTDVPLKGNYIPILWGGFR